MACNVNLELDSFDCIPAISDNGPASPDSCFDENLVHDSFAHLISEHSHEECDPSAVTELEEMPGMGIENLGYCGSPAQAEGWLDVDCYDPATMKVLSFMPSRTIGRSRGAIISEYYNRTLKLRRKRNRPSLKDMPRSMRPSIRDAVAVDGNYEEELEKKKLLSELKQIPASDRAKMLQSMPLNLSMKRELRRMAPNKDFSDSPLEKNRLSRWSRAKYSLIIAVRQCWYGFLSFLHSLQLWQIAQKQISGRFGIGVLSYFIFLKMLLKFNFFLLILNLCFIVIPQATNLPEATKGNFVGLELLYGTGYFTDTVLYHGYYTNNTWNILSGLGYNGSSINVPYNMPIAYLYTVGTSFFITCIILVHCLSKAFGESYRVGSGYRDLAVKVFCFWDFKVTQKQSVELNYEDISTQLKEFLTEHNFRAERLNIFQWFVNLSVHFLGWLLSLGSAVGCAVGVYYYSEKVLKDYSERIQRRMSEKEAEGSLLGIPILVSAINFVMPYIYNLIGLLEKYDFPQQRIYVSITRNLVLKMSIIGLLCFHWIGGNTTKITEISCWETFVGQELYRLVVVDFIFIILETAFGEYVWRLVCIKLLKRKRKPEFDIARNVLDLIYGQTLTWVGLLFAPLIPAIQIIKFVVVFYIKKLSLMMNCQPPRKLWRASHMMTIFISLLCFPSFLGATLAHLYSVWRVKPSQTCGPFRTLNNMYDSAKIWMNQLESKDSKFIWFPWIHKYLVENPFFFLFASGILLIVIYFHWQVLDGQRKIIKLLNEQIRNEGDDKKFLIGKLKDFNKKKFKSQKKQMQEETEV
ncbi:transmembrane channel-like protein 6 isoform X1 [Pristis pectinata]|uniref:transmembrane channel-like protein 6 isoform X1 n=1 Tax=Pristis pectinata TaxID=685728 RepID=UPI00223DD802|nr:transmembrane channel-like protein 6 isoform X1 [Pristis pectinata]XP_051889029.1 transmembrane channel-like protein 6 isoform X1 [Pristis pectinata]XP_051889030.1 transmembrane channel-like protein 6 isoform X1 [Pristis pectinata]XP_051889031.1 transmembrane channel-like protein 6 isoform X1 [Pristis pectinata]XP_051889032.1 transmembrane channel-like protein 6 isoform X1 [Pristis pectinata]XP_051889033.1 transmembrane channel-like protein 6 isoform X1 [Pristis pectinata]XP_051889035.1 tr